MGVFIKCTLRDQDKITTKVLSTNSINDFLSDYKNIFENDIHDLILKNEIEKKYITASYHHEIETMAPFNYGYIFIDRINKKVFLLNNYDSICYFSNFDFVKERYEQLKKQDFKGIMTDSKSGKKTYIDVREEFYTRDYREYKKLFTAIPYLKKIISIDKEIQNISSLESILYELHELRKERQEKNEYQEEHINDLIITEFKDWILIEDNKTKASLTNLFEYLKGEKLLSEKDIDIWNEEIERASD